jgi:hypothetical protein
MEGGPKEPELFDFIFPITVAAFLLVPFNAGNR